MLIHCSDWESVNTFEDIEVQTLIWQLKVYKKQGDDKIIIRFFNTIQFDLSGLQREESA